MFAKLQKYDIFSILLQLTLTASDLIRKNSYTKAMTLFKRLKNHFAPFRIQSNILRLCKTTYHNHCCQGSSTVKRLLILRGVRCVQKTNAKGHGGRIVVSILVFYSDDLSTNPAGN